MVPEIFDDRFGGFRAFEERVRESIIYEIESGVIAFTDLYFNNSARFHITMFNNAHADKSVIKEIFMDVIGRYELDHLETIVPVDNERAIMFVEKLGFIPIERIDKVFQRDSKKIDIIHFRMEEISCRG